MKRGHLRDKNQIGCRVAGCVLDIKLMIKLDDICHKFLYSLFDEVLLDPIAQNDRTDDVIKFVGT